MGHGGDELARGQRGDTPGKFPSFDGFLGWAEGNVRRILEGVEPEELIEMIARIEARIQRSNDRQDVEDLSEYEQRLQYRQKYFEERLVFIEHQLDNMASEGAS